MGQQIDDFDFDGQFEKLRQAYRDQFGSDFEITGNGNTGPHRRLSGGRARDIRSRTLNPDQQQFIIDTSKSLGLDVVDQSTRAKMLKGATGPHIHVGKYLNKRPAARSGGLVSDVSGQAGGGDTSPEGYQGLLDSILSDYGLSDETVQQQPSAPPPPQEIKNRAENNSQIINAPLTNGQTARPAPPAVEPLEPVQAEPPADYARQLDAILSDFGLGEPPPPPGQAPAAAPSTRVEQQPKPRLFEQPDSHNRVAQLRQQNPAGVAVRVQIGDLLDTGALNDQALSDRVMESEGIGMSPDEAKAFNKILADQGRGLPFKLSAPELMKQLGQHRDKQGYVTLHLSPDSLVTYQDYLSSMRERSQREADNYGALTGTIGQRSPFINETVNINARDPNSIFEKAEQRLDADRVMVTYKTNKQTEHATAAEASPDAGTVTEELDAAQLSPQDANKQVMLPIRAGGLLASLDKGQITKDQFLDQLRYRMMAQLGFDERTIAAYRTTNGEDPIKAFADAGVIAKKGGKAKAFEGTSPDAVIESVRKNGGIFDFRVAVPHYLQFKQFLGGQQPDLLPHDPKSADVFDPESVSNMAMLLSAVTGTEYDDAQKTTLQGLTAMGNFGRGMMNTASGAVKGAGLLGELAFTENRPSTWLQQKGAELGQWAQEHTNSDPRYENFWTKDFAQGAGSMSTFMVAGLGGSAAGVPQWLVSASVGAASQASEVYDDARRMGYNHEQALSLSKWGALIGTSEALGMGRILDKIPAHGFFAKAVAVLGEMLEEGGQEFGQNVATNILFGKQPIDTEGVRAGAVGMLLGLGGGVIHESLGSEGDHHQEKNAEESPIPNLSVEQYNDYIERMSQLTGYPKEAIPGLLRQEVLRVNQRGEGTGSDTAPAGAAPSTATDAPEATISNAPAGENISPAPARERAGNLHYVQSPDGRVGVIQIGADGRAQFSEVTNERSKKKALAGDNIILTGDEFDGLFPANPEGYHPGTVELGRVQFLRDEGLIPDSVLVQTQSGGAAAARQAEPAAPAGAEEISARSEGKIESPAQEEVSQPGAETVRAPGQPSVVDQAIYNKARGLVTKTRMVSPGLLSKKIGVSHAEALTLIDRLVDEGVVTRDDQGRLRVAKNQPPAPVSQTSGSAQTVQAPGQPAGEETTTQASGEAPPESPGEATAAPPGEAPPAPAPQGWQEVEGKEPGDKYQQVRLKWKRTERQAGKLYINTAAHDLLSEVYERVTGKRQRFNGAAAQTETLMRVAATAQQMAHESDGTRRQALELLAKELRQAANDELHVVIVNHWDQPNMKIRQTIRHEETHRTQRLLERATGKMPSEESMRALPHMPAISQGLFKRSYPKDVTVLTLEAAAHIAAGEEGLIGITREQAIEFMHAYFTLVKETYGDNALAMFNHLIHTYKEVRDSVIRGEQEEPAAGAIEPDVREVGPGQASGEEEHAAQGDKQESAAQPQEEEDPDIAEARAIQEELRKEQEAAPDQPKPQPAPAPKKPTKPRRKKAPAPAAASGSPASGAELPQVKTTKPPAVAIDDEIGGLLDQLKQIKSKGVVDASLADFSTTAEPGLDELVVMVKLMRAYAQRGVTDFGQAVELFQQHYAQRGDPRAFDRALEIGWQRLAAKPEWKQMLGPVGRVADVLDRAPEAAPEPATAPPAPEPAGDQGDVEAQDQARLDAIKKQIADEGQVNRKGLRSRHNLTDNELDRYIGLLERDGFLSRGDNNKLYLASQRRTYQNEAVDLGDEAKAATAMGTVVGVRYAVIEAPDLVASHDLGLNPNPAYPTEVQPRDRTRATYAAQIEQIKNGLRPFELGASPKASDGAPIVGPDLAVESGNGRTIALQRAYSEGHEKGAEYRQWLIDHAEDFGLDRAKIEGAKRPILVRVRLTDVDRPQFAREANLDDKAQMSATEQAAADAKQLTPELMGIFYPSDAGEIITAANRPFIKQFLSQVVGTGEQNRLIDADGQLTQDGVNRIRNAVFAKAYGDTAEGMNALRKLAESTDNNVRNITIAMLHQAARFAKLKEDIRAGARYDLDITGDIAAAMAKLSGLRESGTTVDEYFRQGSLFGSDLTPFQKRILQVFDDNKRSARLLDKILDNFIRGAELAGDPRQASIFATAAPQKEALFEAAYEEAIKGNGEQAGLFGGEAEAQQPAQDQGLQSGQQPGESVSPAPPGEEPQTGNLQTEGVADNTEGGRSDVERGSTNLEPDRQARDAEQLRQAIPASEPGRTDTGAPEGSRAAGEAGEQPGGGEGLPGGGAAVGRAPGDNGVLPTDAGEQEQPAGSQQHPGSSDNDEQIAPSDDTPAETVERAATSAEQLAEKREAQARAEDILIRLGDEQNVRDTLPFLLPEQQDDVVKAEARFEQPAGFGYMFTNGTGTGKTYTGLGLVKRYERQGKRNIIIIAPNDKIIEDWVTSGQNLSLNITRLDSIEDNGGDGNIVVTTYANFGKNNSLARRQWDLVVPDEAHYLGMNPDGGMTEAGQVLRAITMHPEGKHKRGMMLLPELYDQLGQARAAEDDKLVDEIWAQIREAEIPIREAVDQIKPEDRTRVAFLSATPFAYRKSIRYAQGYLFDWDEGRSNDQGRGYNEGSNEDQFFIQHFGYRMRYGKLTEPDAQVNVELMEQQFNQWLKDQGVLSGRQLDVDADYERKFSLVKDAIGTKIDEGINWLRSAKQGKYAPLADLLDATFTYQNRVYLLEAIKARHAVAVIKKQLRRGRKVVVFHDFNKGGAFHPFQFQRTNEVLTYTLKGGKQVSVKQSDLIADFEAERPDLVKMDFSNLRSPIQTFKNAFPNALYFNGLTPKRLRRRNVALFNDEDGRHRLLIVQSDAGREGISLHDVTGQYQRVLINLGMPVRPTAAIQIEGRIRRTGSVSDAIFLYLNTGTMFERMTFAHKIAERASTAENLALGQDARALKQAFIDAFEDADPAYEPSDEEGKGGKEADRATRQVISEFERAKTFYFAQGKGRKKLGNDYFATPEPVGLKMVEWADIKPGERVLEPSAGHGAIARFFPANSDRTLIEPSMELGSRAALVAPGKLIADRFESHHITNKYDAIVMNPPFGVGGKTAIDHLSQASGHLRDGGRIVALLPEGPMADKRLEKFLYEDQAARHLYKVADVRLPAVTFERAGTQVRTHIVVLEKHTSREAAAGIQEKQRDLTDAENINELFEQIEHISLPSRQKIERQSEQGEQAVDFSLAPDLGEAASAAAQLQADEGEPDFVRRARERLRQQLAGNRLNANPFGAFRDTAIVTGYDVYKRSKEFGAWSAEMVRRLGDRVRPHLKPIFEEMAGFGPRHVLARLKSARLVPDKMVYEMLTGERPEYIDEIAKFISGQRQKVRTGSLTLRDVVKAYYMTVASQGASAIRATTFLRKMKAAGIRIYIPEEYYRINKAGAQMIRPEEAAGAWLMTPHGQRALSDLDRGVFNEELWAESAKVREAFGDDRFSKNNVFGTPAAGSFNMRNVATAVAKMNEARDDSARLGLAVGKLNGIGVGKNGFIKHLLGFGDAPTIDAVEINWWLTGQGKIGQLKSRQAELARAIKDFTGNRNVSRAIHDRILSRFDKIRQAGQFGADLSDEVFNHILHQWIWDRAKNEVNTGRGMYEAMRETEFAARSRERLRRQLSGNQLNMNPVLAMYDEAVVLGSELYKVAKDFGSWSARMMKALGERVKPYLKRIHQRLVEFHKDERGFVQLGLLTGQPVQQPGKPKRKLTAKEQIFDIANVPHALMASGDMSAPLRQGLVLGATEWRAFYRANIAMMTKSWKAAQFDQAMKDLRRRQLYRLARRAGLDLTRMGGRLSQHEEGFMSRIAGRLPWVAISERAYTVFLNTLRMDVFEKYAKQFMRDGKTWKNAEKDFRDVARFINAATGRGDLGKLGEAMGPALNAIFFSPRLVKSRFDLLNPVFYARLSPAARRIAIRKMVGFTGLVGMTIGLAALAGATVINDPDDPDFLKIKIGKTHYDVLAGFQQVIRFTYRFTRGLVNNFRGKTNKWGENPDQLLWRFVRQKFAPAFSFAADAVTGKTFDNKPFKAGAGIAERMLPIMLKDLTEGYLAEGGIGALKAAPSFFGLGVQTYTEKKSTVNQLAELKRLDLHLGKPQRRPGESEEMLEVRAEEQDKLITERVEDLMKTDAYRSLSDDLKKKAIREAAEAARRDHTMATIYEHAMPLRQLAAFKDEARASRLQVMDQLAGDEQFKRLRPYQQQWVKQQVGEMIELPKMESVDEIGPQREAMKEILKYVGPAVKDLIEAARQLEPPRKAS